MATEDQWLALATKIKNNLTALEAMYPDSLRIKILHMQANTAALWAEDEKSLNRGVLGGTAGTVHSDSGGTDKGNSL